MMIFQTGDCNDDLVKDLVFEEQTFCILKGTAKCVLFQSRRPLDHSWNLEELQCVKEKGAEPMKAKKPGVNQKRHLWTLSHLGWTIAMEAWIL